MALLLYFAAALLANPTVCRGRLNKLLTQFPDMPATVIAERIGWEQSSSSLRARIALLRPLYRPVDQADRTTYVAGEFVQCDLRFPGKVVPVAPKVLADPPVLTMVVAYSGVIMAASPQPLNSSRSQIDTWVSHAATLPVSSVGGPCESGPMTKEVQITFDCADPAGLAAFWAEVLGYQVQPPPSGFDSWGEALEALGVPRDQWNSRSAILPIEGPHPRVFFQRVPEGKTVKNRLHLDVRVAPGLEGDERISALEAEANRLEALGATRAYRVEPDKATMESGFITMHDPEGNEFCLD